MNKGQIMKILLIDDDPFANKLLLTQLKNLNYLQVSVCQSAIEALTLLQTGNEHFKLIFCDLQMPEMDGVELLRNLAKNSFNGKLVLITGEDPSILQTAGILAKAHGLDVSGTLHKPATPAELQQVLERARQQPADISSSSPKQYKASAIHQGIINGQMENYYQPKIDLTTGKMAGVEALVRWHHPQDGLVFPDSFITTAEEHGLIDELTQVVLTQAFTDCQQWLHDMGEVIKVSVNVSMINLSHVGFTEQIENQAHLAGVSLSLVILEVTESQLMNDPLTALDILTRMRLKRIGLSIDDFGTGHSSLVQLHDLPFNELKIDKSFVTGAWNDDSIKAFLESSIELAKKLGITTVAEGVECAEDWHFLQKTGCNLAQGYFMSRPMQAMALSDWYMSWKNKRHLFT